MEALELYKDEMRKMEEHKYACQHAGKEVDTSSCHLTFNKSPATLLFPSGGAVGAQTSSSSLRFSLSQYYSLWNSWFFLCVSQLPPPKPNPILVAFGNVTVSRAVFSNWADLLLSACFQLWVTECVVSPSAVPLHPRCHQEGQIQVRSKPSWSSTHSRSPSSHCSVYTTVCFLICVCVLCVHQWAGGVSAGVAVPVRPRAAQALQQLHPAGPGGGAGLSLPLLPAQVSGRPVWDAQNEKNVVLSLWTTAMVKVLTQRSGSSSEETGWAEEMIHTCEEEKLSVISFCILEPFLCSKTYSDPVSHQVL